MRERITVMTASGRIKTKYLIDCVNCNVRTYNFRPENKSRFCSHKCSTIFQYKSGRDGYEATKAAREATKKMEFRATTHKGDRHWNWRGGINELTENARKTSQWKKFRERVLLRDNYQCQICFIDLDNPHVDHIKAWADHPQLRFDMDNCRTLCRACHYYVTFKRKMPNGSRWGLTTVPIVLDRKRG